MSAVRFEAREIILELQHVQPFRSPDKSFVNSDDPNFPTFDIKEVKVHTTPCWLSILSFYTSIITGFFFQIFTYQNMCEAIKFTAIVLMALFTFAVEILRYLGEYSIKLSHVFVSLVHVSTPICLGMFEFLTRCVGGFYWLIYVLFRGTPNTPPVPAALMQGNRRSVQYDQNNRYKPIEYKGGFPNSRPSYSPGSQYSYKYQR